MHLIRILAAGLLTFAIGGALAADTSDPRLRQVWYDPQAVVTVPVKRGIVTDIVLDADEVITDLASGLGGDCTKAEATWCIAAQPGGRHIFVKPKSTAGTANNLAVVTDKRSHSFRLELLAENDARPPVYRLLVRAVPPLPPPALVAAPHRFAPEAEIAEPAAPRQSDVIAERLRTAPVPVNSDYSLAEGTGSEDIVPSLVFDDGRFTYLRFANNREVPAVFHVQGDGSEALVNVRMEGDLLIVDRVSRRLMLRAGNAVVGLWNESFDPDGVPPAGGTTVPGVERTIVGRGASARGRP
ncbi:MAG: TrbG/VirB9 family P-type conjugative transfer protein [Burkholderiales bacterium]|nr:TrbG/VirB9 family P-type conjugative transfer protein [Burkholderiales bacterium]